MNKDKSKLQLIGEIAEANNKNLELIEELNNREDEIERLSNELQVQIEDNTRLNEYIEAQDKKLQQKENIIKEVREYLEIFTNFDECTINGRVLQKAIDILDKEEKDENNRFIK